MNVSRVDIDMTSSPNKWLEDHEAQPCPFCGNDDLYVTHNGSYWLVSCNLGCSASGPECETQEAAIAAWNDRSAGEAQG